MKYGTIPLSSTTARIPWAPHLPRCGAHALRQVEPVLVAPDEPPPFDPQGRKHKGLSP